MSSQLGEIQEFVRKYTEQVNPLPIDPVMLLTAWERERNHLEAFVQDEHESLLESERELEPDEQYYTNAVNQYAVDQSDAALRRVAELLEDNIRQGSIDDGMLLDLCYGVAGEIPAAVIPDDEP